MMEYEVREIARCAANRIADEHKGAWANVMLQVDWMTDVIAAAIEEGRSIPPDSVLDA